MRRKAAWLALLLTLALLLSGCGAAGWSTSETETGASGGGIRGDAYPAAPPVGQVEGAAPAEDGGSPGTSGGTPVVDRKIVQNAEIHVNVKEADEAVTAITQAVRASGGYVQENRVEGTRERGRTVYLTVRVPAGEYGSILDLVAGVGEQINRREWINDVTEEYVDLDARIRTKEIHLEQLQKLYEKGETIKELLELEQEIARVTAELESMKGRLQFLSNQVAFSTLHIRLYEPGVPAPSRNPQTLGERVRDSFLFSWHATVAFGADLLVFLVAMIPRLLFVLVVFGAIGFVVLAIVWLVRLRKRSRSPAKPE